MSKHEFNPITNPRTINPMLVCTEAFEKSIFCSCSATRLRHTGTAKLSSTWIHGRHGWAKAALHLGPKSTETSAETQVFVAAVGKVASKFWCPPTWSRKCLQSTVESLGSQSFQPQVDRDSANPYTATSGRDDAMTESNWTLKKKMRLEVPDSHSRENSSSLKISVCAFVHDNSRKYLSVLDGKGVIESLRGAKVSNNFQSQSLVQCRPRFVVHLGNSPSKSLRSLRMEMPRIQATQQG